LEQLNGNIHFQIFFDVLIDPLRPLTNYKLLDDIASELAGKMKIQELQEQLAKAWKPWMKALDTMYTDATCYESEMRYPTDQKLLWEGIEKLSFNAFGEGTRLKHCITLHKRLFGVDVKKIGGDTTMEGSFRTQKEHYDLKRVKARKKATAILYIFFGIHTANVVNLAGRQLATG